MKKSDPVLIATSLGLVASSPLAYLLTRLVVRWDPSFSLPGTVCAAGGLGVGLIGLALSAFLWVSSEDGLRLEVVEAIPDGETIGKVDLLTRGGGAEVRSGDDDRR